MTARFDEAVQEVEQRLLDLEEIVRVDVDDLGALHLTARCTDRTRWFVHDDRGLIELHPERDPVLPLAARLRANDDWNVLSYRAGRRAVVRIVQGSCTNVVKGHRKGRSARAAVNQSIAEGAMRLIGIRVPRLLRHDGLHEALVFEHADVREIELDASAEPYFERLGGQLRRFQEDPCAEHVKPFRAADEIDVLDTWKRKVRQAVSESSPRWEQGREQAARVVDGLGSGTPVLTHRDLHDRQLFRLEGEVALLDFDLLCQADSALDVGNLIAHLRWRAIQELHGATPESVELCTAALLRGLDRGDEPGFERRLSFYTATALLRLSLVYRVRPRWAPLVLQLVELAEVELGHLTPLS